jgi:tetratricopeptide (TPR) repeat protein
MEKALACYQRALAADPDYALAHAGVSQYYTGSSVMTFAPPVEALPKAREAARRALDLDPELSLAHASNALVYLFLDHNWAESEQSFHRAIELSPEPGTHTRAPYALWHLVSRGCWRDAAAEFDLVLQLDPLHYSARFGKAFALDCQGRSSEAEAVFKRGLEIDPASSLLLRQLAICVARQGRFGEALALAERALKVYGRWPAILAASAIVHAMAGQTTEANGIIGELGMAQRHTYVSAERITAIYSLLGELDQAFAWAQKSVRQHDPALLWVKHSFLFDGMRNDPRYPGLLRALNLG